MYYVVTKNGNLMAVFFETPYPYNMADVSIHEMDGEVPDLRNHIWDADLEEFKESPTALSKLLFLNRFTMAERIAVRSSADPVAVDIMKMLDVAEYVNVQDHLTIQAINYFAAVGLIQPTRVAEILT